MSETVIHNRFADLFAGSDKAFGRCIPAQSLEGTVKRTAKYWTEPRPVEPSDWEDHFKGKIQVGMPPIRSDNTVRWGAIDVDLYGIDLPEVQHQIEKLRLPLVLCRSKSGGIHMFLFLQDWIPATQLISILDTVAGQLGFGSSEIFPKQAKIVEGDSDFGNFINLPYFHGGQDGQIALDPEGNPIEDVEDFLAYAVSRRIKPDDLKAMKLEEGNNTILPEGPPCLNTLYSLPDQNGIRNIILANTAVYLKKKYPDSKEWEEALHEYNAKLQPPLERAEVDNIIKSYNKKDYFYQCSEGCMKRFCNSSVCRTRKCGVGNNSFLSNNRSLTKLNVEPPLWFLDVQIREAEPVRIALQTEELMIQKSFQKKCMEHLNLLPATLKQALWEDQIQQLLEHSTIIEMPETVTLKDRFIDILDQYLETRKSESKEQDVYSGKPHKNCTTYVFKLESLEKYLEDHRFKVDRSNRIPALLREVGGQAKNTTLAGKRTRHWQLPVSWNGSEEIQFQKETVKEPF